MAVKKNIRKKTSFTLDETDLILLDKLAKREMRSRASMISVLIKQAAKGIR